jgi:DNA-binding NarL/FixJ family response regulator
MTIRIFVLDDHELVRTGLQTLLECEEDMEVVGQAATAQLGLQQIGELQPDVAILDVRLPDGSGIEVCREIRSLYPDIACLMLTSYADDEALFSAIMAGAAGYVLKEIGGSDLIGDIRRVSQGASLIDATLSKDIFDRLRKSQKTEARSVQPLAPGAPGSRPDRPGSFQPSDRRGDLPGREDGQELRVEPPLKAGHATPHRGGRLCRNSGGAQGCESHKIALPGHLTPRSAG